MNETSWAIETIPVSTQEPVATSSEDRNLLRAALGGDGIAFGRLVAIHERPLYLYCYKLVGDRDQAADIMQDLWLRVIELEKPERVDNPCSFFFTVARNLCLDHIRRNSRRSNRLLSFLRREESQKSYRNAEFEDDVQIALERLSFEEREIIILRYYSDYSYKEIAEIMKISEGAATMRHKRAKEKMREIISRRRDSM